MSVQVWFGQDDVDVVPGADTAVSLAIENVSDRTESYTVVAAGLTASWTTITRPNVTLFGGSRDVIEVVVRPPAIHSTTAGPTALTVRIIPQSAPDDTVMAETVVNVAPFDDRRLTVLQPLQRARRRATFEFMVENHGNNLASCRLHLVDATERVDGSFDPPAVGVAPGSSSIVRLRLRVRGAYLRRGERQLDFAIDATEPDHDPAIGRAMLVQPGTVPARTLARLAGVVAVLAGLVVAWFALIRPVIDEAVERAVADQLDEMTFEPTSDDVAVPTTTVAPSDAPLTVNPEVGEPVSYRVAVDVGITQERSESITVAPDSELLLTDIVLQNPNGDLGTAQMLRNGDLVYEWDLASMTSPNEFQPRISPLPFDPGDNIVLSVVCEAAGETTGTGCQVALLLTGRLVPATDAGGAAGDD